MAKVKKQGKGTKNVQAKAQNGKSKSSESTHDTVFKIPDDIELPPKDEEELALEKLVFGDLSGFEHNLKDIDNMMNESSDEENLASDNEDGKSDDEAKDSVSNLQDDMLFFMDDADNGDVDVEMKDAEKQAEEFNSESEDEAAWEDSDDEKANINLLEASRIKKLRTSYAEASINSQQFISRLRAQFEKIHPRPLWADEKPEDSDDNSIHSSDEDNEEPATDDEDDELSSTYNPKAFVKLIESNLTYKRSKTSRLLTPKNVNIARLKDANHKHLSKSAIQTIDFHPSLPLLLTGGYDRSLRIYNIDGKNNNVVTSVFFKNSPIQNAYFSTSNTTNKVYLAGRRKFMYKLDLVSGEIEKISNLYGIKHLQKSFENFKLSPLGQYIGLIGNNGYVNILSISNGTFYKNFKINGVVADFLWTKDEQTIFIVNTNGELFEFNFNTNAVVSKWQDENGIGITKIAIGGRNDRYLAIGSSNGIVNIYDRLKLIQGAANSYKPPIGTVKSLVTSISTLLFNFDGQLLCVASRAKKDALRLVHIPSCSVFQNWPTSGTPLGKVTAVAFSANSEMLAVGNEAGKARLFQLNDY